MSLKLTEEKKQRLIDKVIEQIKYDVAMGDVEALDELLKFCSNQSLFDFLCDDCQKEYNDFEKDIEEFKKNWGQSHSDITAILDYPRSHSESDELLMVDYFFLESDKRWYPKISSCYTDKEQEIADKLREQ